VSGGGRGRREVRKEIKQEGEKCVDKKKVADSFCGVESFLPLFLPSFFLYSFPF
jgi:hypothetical protein